MYIVYRQKFSPGIGLYIIYEGVGRDARKNTPENERTELHTCVLCKFTTRYIIISDYYYYYCAHYCNISDQVYIYIST